ncbi:TetR/AcrR family transcriptional regulator [Dyella sp. A6]|uniref:TetR/AcrR family transcriptional regulator n=1 Tax=Dyella aluminiiresistens TaxID=3069105 RepID=UPI002E762DA9|nr:TetR/AcrR family transcriptional regulator [Dyella sp. A6]
MSAAAATDIRQHILDTAQVLISGRGFTAVGLSEILHASNVPKGSFYHYFPSKEAFGESLLQGYFDGYLADLERVLTRPGLSAAERLMNYWQNWLETQTHCDPKGKCLAVKLAAEVSDLSEAMRGVLEQGTDKIIARLAQAIDDGFGDGSLPVHEDAPALATTLYQLWLGASLRAKITRDRMPLAAALAATQRLLGLPVQPTH